MEVKKMEVRFNDFQVNENEDKELVVSGYVNKTNQWSQVLGQRKKFVERILPGTFTRALGNGNEVHFYAEHDPSKILASTRNGSLNLREDENGLYMEATIEPTSWGKDYHTLIQSGIIRNMSFGMQVLKDSWRKMTDGTYERSISDLYLSEVSAVRNPAYVQSTISARGIDLVEDVEPTVNKQEENREQSQLDEHPLEDLIKNKKSSLKLAELLVANGDKQSEKIVAELKGEIRQMEALLEKQTTTVETEKQEQRAITEADNGFAGPKLVSTSLVKEKAKKLNGKHSVLARTKMTIQKGGKLDVFLRDGENSKKSSLNEFTENVDLNDFTAQKVTISTARFGHGMEVSEALIEMTSQKEVNQDVEDTLMGRIDDDVNYSIFNGSASFDSINADTSVSSINSTTNINQITLVDVLTLIGKLNQEYRDEAAFYMHTNVFNQILANPDFALHLKFDIDEVTGKKMYFIFGYPAVVNDNAGSNRIIFGNMFDGYRTLLSTGPDPFPGKDIFGNPTLLDQRSFALQKATDTTRQLNGTPVYLMHAFFGGKVINKDCFVRLDVKTA
ncbi:HK97 family phage prohead protease [Neobacillus mesonae]|uniref:Phage major capsid protein n=1 Tax=Neobacillus mesonae TaxID=1193713 RepID=A0A3Q9QVX8_9BACI|nr:HK97 family phage prohead protease [Neobacillus mesonae]AZU60097.1 phage major capsid protein [Neobacillus mesonae]